MKNLIVLILALTLGASLAHADSTTVVTAGKRVIMNVAVAGGTQPFTYQWYKNGVALAGANQSSNGIQSIAVTDSGVYTVVVKNAYGEVTSDAATINVNPAPTGPGKATITVTVVVTTEP